MILILRLNARESGELEKKMSEVCGVEAVDAHHDRYDQSLKYGGCAGYITPVFTNVAKTCSHLDHAKIVWTDCHCRILRTACFVGLIRYTTLKA